MKSTIRFLIWLMTLNLLMNFIFPEPVELWKFLLIETCLGFLSFIMVDWKEDKWGERVKYREEKKDLFTVSEDYYLAHCISADFGMGKGIVVEFNKRFDMKRKLQTKYPDYLNQYTHKRIGGDCLLEDKAFNLITKERYFHKPTIITMRLALEKMKQIGLYSK